MTTNVRFVPIADTLNLQNWAGSLSVRFNWPQRSICLGRQRQLKAVLA